MWTLADRFAKTFSDYTIGTAIVLAHVVLANRETSRSRELQREAMRDGTRVWRTQISP